MSRFSKTSSAVSGANPLHFVDELAGNATGATVEVGESCGDFEFGDNLAFPKHELVPRRLDPAHLLDPGADHKLLAVAGRGKEPRPKFDNHKLPPVVLENIETPAHVGEILDTRRLEVREVVGVVYVVVGVQLVEADL